MNSLLKLRGINSKLAYPLVKLIKDFYSTDVVPLVNLFQRSILYSIVLFIFREIILYQTQVVENQDMEEAYGQFNQIISILFRLPQKLRKSLFSDNDDEVLMMVYVFFTFNIVIFLYIWVCLLWRQQNYNKIHFFFSFLIQSYEYLFCLPSYLVSLSVPSNIISILNFLLTFLIGTLIVSIDYSYEFESKDLLKKMDSTWNMISFLVDTIILISYQFSNKFIHQAITICANIIKLVYIIKTHQYLNSWICRYFVVVTLYKLCISFLILLLDFEAISNDIMFLGCLVFFPISLKIGFFIFQNYYNFLILELLPEQRHANNDSYLSMFLKDTFKNRELGCRILYTYSIQKDDWNSIIEQEELVYMFQLCLSSEQFMQTNIETNDKISKIKKEKEKKKPSDQLEIKKEGESQEQQKLSENLQAKLINDFIQRIFKQMFVKNNVCIDQHFSYLSFLISSQDNDCLPYRAILNLKAAFLNKLELKQQQKVDTIMRQADQKVKLRSILVKKNIDLELHSILEFDNSILKVMQDYFTCLKLQKDAVTQISQTFIDLNISFTYLTEFRKERNALEILIKEMITKNSQSEQLRNICLNFDFYLNQNAFVSAFFEKKQRQQHQLAALMKEYYNPFSCFAYVSLLKKTQGTIIRISRSFTKVFGLANKHQALLKDFTQFFNNCINIKYDGINLTCNKFIKDNFSNYNEIYNIPLIIGRDGFGFSLPMRVQIQSQKIEQNDFGFTIWAKPIRDDKVYVLLESRHPSRISSISRSFRDTFLYDDFNLAHLSKTRIDQMIPALKAYLYKTKEFSYKFDTLLIRPNGKNDGLEDVDLNDPQFLHNLYFRQLFFISLTITKVKNKLVDMMLVEIESYYFIHTQEERVQSLQSYAVQLKELCDKDLEFNLETVEATIYAKYQTNRVKTMKQSSPKKLPLDGQEQFSMVHSLSSQKSMKKSQFPDIRTPQTSKERIDLEAVQELPNENDVQQQIIKDGNSQIIVNHVDEDYQEQLQQQIEFKMHSSIAQEGTIEFSKGDYMGVEFPYKQSQLNNQEITQQIESDIINLQTTKDNTGQLSHLQNGGEFGNHQILFENMNQHRSSIENANQQNAQDYSMNQHGQQDYPLQSNDVSFDKQQSFQFDQHNHKDYSMPMDSRDTTNNLISQKSNMKSFFSNLKRGNLKFSGNNFITVTNYDSKQINTQGEATQQKKNNEIISISSSQRSVTDQHLIKMIHAKKEMVQLRVINVLGLLSILIALVLTLTGFQVFFSRMLIQQRNFKFINWLYNMNFQISQAYSEQNIKYLNQGGFWKLSTTDSDSLMAKLKDLMESRYTIGQDLLIAQQNCTDSDIQVFQIIKDKRLTQQIYYSLAKNTSIDVSLLYSLEMQVGNTYFMVYEQDPGRVFRKAGQSNYPQINALLTDVNAQISETYQVQLQDIQNQTQIQLFVVMAVSFVFLFSILPSYSFSKLKQQQVMELFATFDPKHLKEILMRIFSQIGSTGFSDKASLMITKLSQSNMNSEPSKNFDISVHVTKKMNISRTSKLNYSIKLLFFSIVVLFSCIMVYPVSNYLIVQKFMENSKIIFNFNGKYFLIIFKNNDKNFESFREITFLHFYSTDVVTDVYFTLVNSLRARQGVSLGYLMPQYAGLPLTHFQELFESLIPLSQEQMKRLQDNVGAIKDTTLYNDSEMKGFLIGLFENNACDTLKEYPQYTYENLNLTACNSVNRAILKQGTYLGLQSFFLRFIDNFDFVYSYDATSYQKSLDVFNSAANALGQLLFKDQLTILMDYTLSFLYDQNTQLYAYYMLVSIFMLIYQLLLILLLYFFGWRLYYRKINQIIFDTKDLLDIFPSIILLQNSYIMSFLKKNE